jgi:hypothetical protein
MMGLNAMVESASFVVAPIIGSFLLSLRYSGFYPTASVLITLIAAIISLIPLREVSSGLVRISQEETP